MPLDPSVLSTQSDEPRGKRPLDDLLKGEGAEHLKPVIEAIYSQESGSGKNSKTSVDGARGPMQIMPGTFKQLARDGESIDNPDDNMRVGIRLIKALGDKFSNDPARIAAAYFSGEGNVNPTGDQILRKDKADGNGKRVSSYVQDVLNRIVPSAQAAEADVSQLSIFKDNGPDDKLAALSIFKEQPAAPAPATSPEAKGGTLLDDVKKAVGWREGEKFTRPEGVTDATFSAGVADVPPEGPVVRGSVLDGSPVPDVPRPAGVPMQAERLQQFRTIARDQPSVAKKMAAREDWAGQAMRAILAEQGVQVERIQQGDNLIAPNRRDMADRATLARQAELAPGGEDNAKIAYNQKGDIGKNMAHVTQGVAQGVLDIRDGVIGAGQAALRLVGATGAADVLQQHQEELKAQAANLDLPSTAQYGAKTVQAVTRSITMNVPGLLTGAEAPALAAMGIQSFGQEFGTGRAAGMTDAEAAVRAGIYGAAEILGEKFGLGDTLKGLKAAANGVPTSEVVGFFGRALAKEIPGEQLTSAIEFGADKYLPQGLHPQATFDDYLRVVGDTLVQTVLQSGLMMGGGAAASKAVQAIDQQFPQAALARALREQVEGGQFDPNAIDRVARLQLDPNTNGNTEVLPEARGFAKAPAGAPEPQQQQPAAVTPLGNDPLQGAPVTNPIASELASLEGEPAPTGQPQAEPTLAGKPVSQHTPTSLSFLMNAHPDQVVREQAAQALQQQQQAANEYSVVTQTERGPVESKIDSALKGQISDATVHTLATETDSGRFSLLTPASAGSFSGGVGGVATSAESFAQLINAISGRNVIVAQGVPFRGVVADGRNIILNQQQGAEGLKAVAFHEVRHTLADDHPDLSAFWRDAVQQHLDTSDGALLNFMAHAYQDAAFAPERIAAMRAKGRSDSQILNAILAKHAAAQSYEDQGRGSRRDWVLEEMEADALGDAANRDGVIHKALDYMAKVDIGLVKQFAQFVKGVLQRMGKGFGSEGYIKGSTEEEIRARLEALDRAAAEVLGRYASRTQNQKRMQSATPAELLLIKKSHPDAIVRDMAAAELKKRETEAAYAQREEQKAGEKENFKRANTQAKLEQAEAEAKAAGTDDGTPTALAKALVGAKKDIQALRRQLAKEMKKAAATARGNAQVRQSTLEDNEAGRFSPKREAADQTLPTRWPTSKRMTPSVNDPMLADLATLRETPKQFEQAVNALAEEPGMRSRARSTEGKLDAILDKMTSNLLWLHDMVPAEIRERSKLWYDGANTIASNWAKTYGKTRSQTAGILAVLSPQKDWFMNVTMAERVLDILSAQMDHPFDAKMRGAAFKFLVKDFAKAEDKRDNLKAFEGVKGKTLKEAVETGDLRQAGIWLRAYDEAYHDPRHAVIHPEGDFGDNARTMTGTETLRAWGDFNALGKAASIFLDGSAENINAQLGGEHKVRNFYNNIYAPKDERFATIDTHAVAADLLRPLAGADKPVADNFGASGGSDLTGVSGTYPIHLEAYRRAAEARGVLPREMQSITWEAVRGLFTEGFKGKKDNLKAIDSIWREVDKGKLTVSEARAKILEMAGGMEHPDWWNGQEPQSEGKAKSYSQKRPTFTGNKIVFEVAPDPHDTQLTQRWNALPEDLKGRISYDIAWDTAGKLLGYYNSDNIKGELHTQVGGYLEDTNPSFSLWMNKYASMVKVQEIANVLGYVLKQDSMVIGSPKKFKGGSEMGMVVIRGVSDTNAKKVYDELRTAIRAEDGSALINGHTTAENAMSILVNLGTQVQIAQRVAEHLGDRHDVYDSTTFVQWPERGENEYGLSGKQEDNGAGPEPSLRKYAHQLREEAATELERRIAGRFSPDRSDAARDERTGGSNAETARELASYGRPAPGAVSAVGRHYSAEQRERLDGRYYGTGARGKEGPRVRAASDPRIKERIYFYVNRGNGITPEQGVGSHAHDIRLDNLYDANADTWVQRKVDPALRNDDALWLNAFESAVIDSGFDGYLNDFGTQRAAVLLGRHNVQPTYVGQNPAEAPGAARTKTPAAPAPKSTDADKVEQSRVLPAGQMSGADWKRMLPAVVPGIDASMLDDAKIYYKSDVVQAMRGGARLSRARAQTETPEFKKWFGKDSNLRNEDGSPMVLYHGTNKDFAVFKASKTGVTGAGVYLGIDPGTGESYAGDEAGANVMPVYARGRYIGLDAWSQYVRKEGSWAKARAKAEADGVAGIIDVKIENAVNVFDPANIKSAIGNNGQFDGANPDIRFSPARQPIFYSQLARQIEQAPDRIFTTAPQVKLWLNGNAAKLGIKKDEIQWSGINEWLDMQGKGKVAKQQVLDYLAQGGVQIEEVEKGKDGYSESNPTLPKDSALKVVETDEEYHGRSARRFKYVVMDEESDTTKGWGNTREDAIADAYSGHPEYWEGSENTKYGEYTLPGGENYRELLLTLPSGRSVSEIEREWNDLPVTDPRWQSLADERQRALGQGAFRSNHWEEANILAHIRFNERTDAKGNRVLFIEEVQSDWGQEGKKRGFNAPVVEATEAEKARFKELDRLHFVEMSPAERIEYDQLLVKVEGPDARKIPAAPFVTDTKAWVALALKRMMRYAADNGFQKIAFVNGEQSADRYDLSKQITTLYAGMAIDGKYLIGADGKSGRDIIDQKVTKEELPGVVGKELAEKIIQDVTDEDTNAEYTGLDLKVGGEGMKTFYDKIVPQVASDLLKKMGGKLETVQLKGKGRLQQPGFAVPAAASEPMPLFSWARRFSDEEGKAATALMTYLAEDKAMFQVPISQAETLPEIVKEIDPAANIKDVSKWFDDGRTVWRLTLPKVGNRAADAYITERDGKVWINAASLEEGSDGNRIYAMVGNYAYNTGKVFIGDPEGITTAGMRRRAENMMSLALKFGTTDFIEPHEKMLKLLGMTWEKGNEQKNLQSLLNTTYNTNVSLTNGEIADVTFNFDDGKFYKNGSVFDDAAFARLAAGVRGTGGLNAAGAPGTRSLRVAALVNTVLSRANSAERGALLESVRAFRAKEVRLADSNNGGVEGPLHSLRYSRIRDAVDGTIRKLDAAVDGLSNLPDQFDYLTDRYLALGKIARVDEIAAEIRKSFEGVPQADKQAVYAYLTTRGASPTMIGHDGARAMAQRIKQTINYVGDALVSRGLLDPAVRAKYKDQYLPRLYLKHAMSDMDWKMIGAGKKPSDMGYLKHRKDIPVEVRELVLGEIKDPAYLSASAIGRAMRDVSLLDWLGRISQNGNWVYPDVFVNYKGQRVTAFWLKAEAARINNQIPHYTPANQTRAKLLVDNMNQLADQALANLPQVNGQNRVVVDHVKYRQIPDTIRYGLLRGMLVREEIYDDVMGASQIINAEPTWFEDWFGFGGKGTRLTQWWKFSKVALNPPGQVRNFLSNMVMLQLSGVGLHKLPVRLVQAVEEIANDGPHWKVAKKYGVTESTFTAQELYRIKRDLIALEAQSGGMNPLTWLRVAAAHVLDKVSNLYQFSEALGKTIKIIDEMEKGKTEAEAAIEAQKWLFDYSLVPQSVRIARNAPVGLPFLTYQVKVLPRLLEVAAKHPWRFLPWVGLFYGMQSYVASLFGVDEDELKKLKKSLPQWLQDRSHTVFLPTRDADGRVQVADVGYFFPWTFYTQFGMHMAGGEFKKALVDDLGGQFSAPILGAAQALGANYNTFTHKPIYNEDDPASYKAAAIANYAWDLMAPPFISSHGFVSPMGLADKQYGGKMVQAATGTTNKFGDPKATEAQAIAGLMGFNFYGMDPEHTRATNMQLMARKVQNVETTLKQRMMDRGLTAEQRAKYIADYQAKMVELAEEAKKYAEESEVPEQLRVRK